MHHLLKAQLRRPLLKQRGRRWLAIHSWEPRFVEEHQRRMAWSPHLFAKNRQRPDYDWCEPWQASVQQEVSTCLYVTGRQSTGPSLMHLSASQNSLIFSCVFPFVLFPPPTGDLLRDVYFHLRLISGFRLVPCCLRRLSYAAATPHSARERSWLRVPCSWL